MIKFERYSHVNDFIDYYINDLDQGELKAVIQKGVEHERDAKAFSVFVWEMVDRIHKDEENGVEVLGSVENTDILPDIAYEVTGYMRDVGFYSVWEKISEQN